MLVIKTKLIPFILFILVLAGMTISVHAEDGMNIIRGPNVSEPAFGHYPFNGFSDFPQSLDPYDALPVPLPDTGNDNGIASSPAFIWAVPSSVGVHPMHVAVDHSGNIYAADPVTHNIWKFNSNGSFVKKWGSNGTGPNKFLGPRGIAVNSSGYIFVSDGYIIQVFTPAGGFIRQWNTSGITFVDKMTINASGYIYAASYYNVTVFSPSGSFVRQWGSYGTGNGQFYITGGIAVNSSGFVYVTDEQNHRVQVFTPSGVYVSQWGSKGIGNYQFNYPRGISINRSGYIYVSDFQDIIRVFSPSGQYIMQWGTFGADNGDFFDPYSLATDSHGTVIVADEANYRIQEFTPSGTYIRQWGAGGNGNGKFILPYGVAANSSGYVYVADRLNNRIQVFSPNGKFVRKWGSRAYYWNDEGKFAFPESVAVNASGYIYVGDGTGRIQVFTPSGKFIRQWGSQGSGNGQFFYTNGIVFNKSGFVYVLDTSNHRVQLFTPDGVYVDQWAVSYSFPRGIAINASGYLYVAETNINRIRVIAPDGTFVRQWGSAGPGDDQFFNPTGVAIDSEQNVYVADAGYHRIKVFTPSGIFLRKWGAYGTSDGQYIVPHGLFIDKFNNIYTTETTNNRIQKFSLYPFVADLEISPGNITITPADARPSHSADIAVKIVNSGTRDAESVRVRFSSNDSAGHWTQIGNDILIQKIAAGQIATVHAPWTVESGKFITVSVDPLNTQSESNEENNIATRMSIRITEIIVRLAEMQTSNDIDNLIRYAKETGAEGISVSFKDDDTGTRFYEDPVARERLKAIISKAHNRSIKVYAWIPVFHDHLAANRFPSWRSEDKNGPLPDFISPIRANVRTFQLDNISTIVKEYKTVDGKKGIDGVRLDFCRYTSDWEDWSSASRQKFHAQNPGIDLNTIDPANKTAWIRWIDWRADQITSFIDQADARVKAEDPGSETGVYLMPFSVNRTYHDNSNTGQDYSKIGAQGVRIMPMVYWQNWSSQDRFENWTHDIIFNSREKGGTRSVPVISITNKIDDSPELWYERALTNAYIEKYLARSAQIIQKNGGNEIALFYYNKWGEAEKNRVQKALSFRPEYNLLRPSPYTERYVFNEAPPYTDFDIYSTWEAAPANGHIFAAFDFGFQAGPGGYIGTQINEDKKLAFFSIWDYKKQTTALPAVPSMDNCVRFGNEGSGISCNITYDWQQGRDYRLRVVKIGSDQTGDIWKGSITDTVTQAETLIGYIHVANSNNFQGYGGLTNYPGNFLEYFYGMESYLNQPHARVKWTGPLANYGSIIANQAYAGYYSTETLHQNVYSQGYPSTVLEAGETIWLKTPQGTPLWKGTTIVADFTAKPLTGTAPLTVQFADKSTNAPSSWKWTFGDESDVNSTKKNPVHTYRNAGTYTVFLRATNAIGSVSTTKTGYISVT